MRSSGVAVLIALGTLSSLGGGLLGPVYPIFLVNRLSASLVDVGALTAIFGLVAALLKVPAGRLVDQWGKERVYCLGISMAAACSLSYIFVSALPHLYIIETLYGIAYAFQGPALLAITMEMSERGRRGFLLGTFESFYDISASVAALVAVIIVSRFGFEWLFAMCSGCQASAGLFVVRFGRSRSA